MGGNLISVWTTDLQGRYNAVSIKWPGGNLISAARMITVLVCRVLEYSYECSVIRTIHIIYIMCRQL
jgi:hypothetical protein